MWYEMEAYNKQGSVWHSLTEYDKPWVCRDKQMAIKEFNEEKLHRKKIRLLECHENGTRNVIAGE